jgi:hypothetical protein
LKIEAVVLKYQETCNNYDAAATAALFTLDAVEMVGSEMADRSDSVLGVGFFGRKCGGPEGYQLL